MASSLFFSAYEKLLLLPCAPRREISSHGVDLPPCHVPHPRLSLSLSSPLRPPADASDTPCVSSLARIYRGAR